jgi:hypothetical protein
MIEAQENQVTFVVVLVILIEMRDLSLLNFIASFVP